MVERVLALMRIDPGLGGVITVGFRADGVAGVRIPPHAALTAYRTPWGEQPGLLDRGGCFVADLDVLPAEAQAVLAQRLDAGGATLVANCSADGPWGGLADRVAFLATDRPCERPPLGRPLVLDGAIEAIAAAAGALQVEGHRAEVFALRAAWASARADGRRRLHEGDVAEAIALVLGPRGRAAAGGADHAPPRPGAAVEQDHAEAPVLPVPLPPLPAAVPQVPVRPALHGAPTGVTVPGRHRRGTLDLTATLLASLPWRHLRGEAPFRPADLRWQLRRPRLGRLVVCVVDGSGSMGPRRLGQAKGAVLGLLQQAYRKRDQVALVLAAGQEARLLLPPARAVEQARHSLLALPAGGGTPLAGALLIAHQLAARALRREQRQSLLLLLTDGRANVPLPGGDRSTVTDELQRACRLVRRLGAQASVISEPGAEAVQLSTWLGAGTWSYSAQPFTRL